MTKRRSPVVASELTPTYEDEIAIANKITIAPHTDHERTIRLKVPRGRVNRKKTAELLPLLGELQEFADDSGAVDMKKMGAIISKLWGSEKFEDEIIPFALQMEEDLAYLEELTMMEVFQAFMEAASYILGGEASTPEFEEAAKKSTGEDGEANEDTSALSPRPETTD